MNLLSAFSEMKYNVTRWYRQAADYNTAAAPSLESQIAVLRAVCESVQLPENTKILPMQMPTEFILVDDKDVVRGSESYGMAAASIVDCNGPRSRPLPTGHAIIAVSRVVMPGSMALAVTEPEIANFIAKNITEEVKADLKNVGADKRVVLLPYYLYSPNHTWFLRYAKKYV